MATIQGDILRLISKNIVGVVLQFAVGRACIA